MATNNLTPKYPQSKSPEYFAYQSAKGRCRQTNNAAYNLYGGRGIEFRFTSFQDFFNELGYRPSSGYSLERKNTNGHYEPGNVKWATWVERQNNRRNNRIIEFQGQSKTGSVLKVCCSENYE